MADKGGNEDIGYHDLLFNSAVACILLFIIFSVKVGANSTTASIGSSSGALSSSYSIIPSELLGEMISIRMVKISGISSERQSAIKNWFLNNKESSGWRYQATDLEDSTIPEQQVHIDGDAVVFTLILSKLNDPNVTFKLNPNLIPQSDGTVFVQGVILEASSALKDRESFKGYYGTGFERRNPKDVQVEFRVIGTSSFENSIKIL